MHFFAILCGFSHDLLTKFAYFPRPFGKICVFSWISFNKIRIFSTILWWNSCSFSQSFEKNHIFFCLTKLHIFFLWFFYKIHFVPKSFDIIHIFYTILWWNHAFLSDLLNNALKKFVKFGTIHIFVVLHQLPFIPLPPYK